jgi:hypothetical protein
MGLEVLQKAKDDILTDIATSKKNRLVKLAHNVRKNPADTFVVGIYDIPDDSDIDG